MQRTAFLIRCGVGAAFGVAVSLLAGLAVWFGAFRLLDAATLDALFRIRGARRPFQEVLLVNAPVPDEPVPEGEAARAMELGLLERIARQRPDAIVCLFDPFSPGKQQTETVAQLQGSAYPNLSVMIDRLVVAPVEPTGSPQPDPWPAPWRSAHARLNVEEDAVVRSVTAEQPVAPHPLVAAALEAAAAVYGVSRIEPVVTARRIVSYGYLKIPVDDEGRMLINYRGPPGTLESLSGKRILDSEADARRCQGRLVIVAAGREDAYATPYSSPEATKMTMLEVQGNAAATVLSADFLAQSGRGEYIWGLIAVGLLFGAALPNLRAADKAVLTAGLLTVTGGASYVLFAYGAFFLPVPPLIAVMTLSYVAMSVHEVVRANSLVNRETEMLLTESAGRRRPDPASGDPDVALLCAMHALCSRLPLVGCAVAFGRYRDKGNIVAFQPLPEPRARGAFLRRSDVGMWEVLSAGRTVLLPNPEDSATRALGVESAQGMYVPLEVEGHVAAALAMYQERAELLTEDEVQVARMTMEQALVSQQRRHLFTTIQTPHRTSGSFSDENLEQRLAMLAAIRLANDDERAVAEAVLGSVTDGVLMFNLAGELVTWNPTASDMLQIPPEEMASLDFSSFMTSVSEADEEEAARTAVDLLSAGDAWAGETTVKATGRAYVVTANRVMGRHRKPLGIVATLQDVTHFRETARMKDELISIATHELRTPLTSILGYAELLADEDVDPDTARKSTEVIYRQANHLAVMIDDFLDVSRIESGREELHLEPVDVLAVARQCLSTLQPTAQARHILVKAEADGEQSLAHADRRKLERVFNNLVSNAIKYSPDGAEVDVTVSSQNGLVSVAVRDTGYGIPTQELDRIFEKFYRVRDRNTRDVRGTGLGLPLVKLIVESHGGTIAVDSEIGRGSTFTFTLPTEKMGAAAGTEDAS
jgi:signal transduction histidine kinase/CHASE2 domain-containing sensor protein